MDTDPVGYPMPTARLVLALTAAASLLAAAARAQTPDSLRALVVTTELQADRESPNGRNDDPQALRPGDVVRHRITFTNTRQDSVRGVRFNDVMPPGLRYVPGSARADRADVQIEFSIDHGRTYSERPEIKVAVNGADVRRAAPPERYTHVRWSERGWVQPRGKFTAEFSVQYPVVTEVVTELATLEDGPSPTAPAPKSPVRR